MIRAEGLAGRLLASGRVVATLAEATLLAQGDQWHVKGACKAANSYWLQHVSEFTVTLRMGAREWRFTGARVESLVEGQVALSGTGKPEVW
ncbi:MAG TPA: hypothetical protein PK406_00605 [Verrucomicrobiota bacterium]|nr:hypothetical protein [Verrucomicrobiota bacterium]